MELKREDIVKALECCLTLEYGVACKGCPLSYKDERRMDCLELLMKSALSLIKELTEENERLTGTLEEVTKRIDNLIEKTPIAFDYERAQAKADTVKKIVERLSDDYEFDCRADIDTRTLSHSDLIEWVTQIAEEIIGTT